ncbi:PREDICTED: transcription initiation factor TFIID subunit 7-like [Condylura cristata]|uniref:transcription initiation factor TFIID subunit 7-like n=1 Tax=Condylura cristata TaxID=143302 RepID=UPI000642946B|nr:PREDICTED: transcription initiation factor TFIID subunit 7-like [Condylura cristata]
MNKSQDQPPHELENQFILRLPLEHASTVRKIVHSRCLSVKDKLKIDLSPGRRHAVVEVEDVSLAAKLVDLPCVIGSLKTLDKKTFYKTANISQMLVCTADDGSQSSEESFTSPDVKTDSKSEKETQKEYVWKHGITPPLKNVRKRRFRKTTKKTNDTKQVEETNFTEEKGIPAKHSLFSDSINIPPLPPLADYVDSPDVEKEVKRLLYSDAEAVSARWEVIGEDETKEIESQGSIRGFALSRGTSGHKQKHTPPSEYNILQEMFRDSSSNSSDEEDEDEDEEYVYDYDEEEDESYEEDMERKLHAKLLEARQYGGKEIARSLVVEIQKQIGYLERKLQNIQSKAQRQRNVIRKVENLTLKNHIRNVLEQLKLQEKHKSEQLKYLREQLKYYMEK